MIPQFVIPLTNCLGQSFHFSSQPIPKGEHKKFDSEQSAKAFLDDFVPLSSSRVEELYHLLGQFPPNVPDEELTPELYAPVFAKALVNGSLYVASFPKTKKNATISSEPTPVPKQVKAKSKQNKAHTSSKTQAKNSASAKPLQTGSECHEKAGDPVSLVTGEEILTLNDVELPNGFVWSRTYRSSKASRNQGLGYGWRHAFQFELKEVTDEKHNVTSWEFVSDSADEIEFEPVEHGSTSYQVYVGASCHFLNPNTRIVTLSSGDQYRFELVEDIWLLKQIRNGIFSTFQLRYSRNHRLIEVAHNKRPVLECQYDKQGRLVELLNTKTEQVLTTYIYDEQDDLVSATNDLGLTERYEYQDQHLIAKRVRPTGFTHHFEWSGEGSSAKCIRNFGDSGIYDYRFHYEGAKSSYSDSLDNEWTFIHDEQGHLLEKSSPTGRTWQWHYDHLGRKEKAVFPDNSTTQYQYNQQGQLISKLHSSGAQIQYGYDSLGKLVKTVSPDGDLEKAYYNSLGQRVWDIDALGCVTEYEYDKHGQVVKRESEDGKKSRWWWDKQQRLVAHEVDGTLLRYSYGATDLVNGIAYPDGCVAQISYDDYGRRTSIRYFNDEDKVGYSEEYAYDEFSRVAQIHTPEGVTSYQWGALAQQEAVIFPNGSHISYEYDQQRNLTKLVRSDGLEFEFLYDSEGLLSGTVGFDGLHSQFKYDSMGRIIRKDVADRTVLYRYDDAGFLQHIKAGNGKNIVENHFNYTLGGRLTLASNRHQTLQYQYSSFGHLTKRIQGQFEIGEEFNRVGQRVSQTLPDKTSLNFSYDTNGRLSEIRFSDDSLPKIEFQYDVMGRLSVTETESFKESKLYDGVGRLVEQQWSGREKNTYTMHRTESLQF